MSAVAAAGKTLHDVPLHSSGCFAWREAAAEDQLLQNAANVGKHCSAFKLQTERSGIFGKRSDRSKTYFLGLCVSGQKHVFERDVFKAVYVNRQHVNQVLVNY